MTEKDNRSLGPISWEACVDVGTAWLGLKYPILDPFPVEDAAEEFCGFDLISRGIRGIDAEIVAQGGSRFIANLLRIQVGPCSLLLCLDWQ